MQTTGQRTGRQAGRHSIAHSSHDTTHFQSVGQQHFMWTTKHHMPPDSTCQPDSLLFVPGWFLGLLSTWYSTHYAVVVRGQHT